MYYHRLQNSVQLQAQTKHNFTSKNDEARFFPEIGQRWPTAIRLNVTVICYRMKRLATLLLVE